MLYSFKSKNFIKNLLHLECILDKLIRSQLRNKEFEWTNEWMHQMQGWMSEMNEEKR